MVLFATVRWHSSSILTASFAISIFNLLIIFFLDRYWVDSNYSAWPIDVGFILELATGVIIVSFIFLNDDSNNVTDATQTILSWSSSCMLDIAYSSPRKLINDFSIDLWDMVSHSIDMAQA